MFKNWVENDIFKKNGNDEFTILLSKGRYGNMVLSPYVKKCLRIMKAV